MTDITDIGTTYLTILGIICLLGSFASGIMGGFFAASVWLDRIQSDYEQK